jgi:hypothetical protein
MLSKSRGNQGVQVSSNLSEEQNHQHTEQEQVPKSPKASKLRKAPMRLPFPAMVGPKCLRLVEAINDGSVGLRRRRSQTKEGTAEVDSMCSASTSEEEVSQQGEEELVGGDVTELVTTEMVVTGQRQQEFELEVVLPIEIPIAGQSGVHVLLNEDNLQDVQGFLHSREDPGGKIKEAEQLIEIQQELGVIFDTNKQASVDLLLKMEDRDRNELVQWQESNGCQ